MTALSLLVASLTAPTQPIAHPRAQSQSQAEITPVLASAPNSPNRTAIACQATGTAVITPEHSPVLPLTRSSPPCRDHKLNHAQTHAQIHAQTHAQANHPNHPASTYCQSRLEPHPEFSRSTLSSSSPQPPIQSRFEPTLPDLLPHNLQPPHPLSNRQATDRHAIDRHALDDRTTDDRAITNPYLPEAWANIEFDLSWANRVRPRSGSQLYRQRLEALRQGKTYTRLPADSFREVWANATQQPTYEQWVTLLQREAAVMARGQGKSRLTVIVGDSLSLWFPVEQLPTHRFWLNQGISGDTTAGILKRLSAFDRTHPDVIHVMAGVNDLRRGKTNAEILTNLQQIMQELRQTHPQAQIFIHSILPTRLAAIPSDRIHQLNDRIAQLTQQEKVSYLDLTPYFVDRTGILQRDLTTDGLHLSPKGYAVWNLAIQSLSTVAL